MTADFSTEGGFNQLDVQIQQRPLLGWAVMTWLSLLLLQIFAVEARAGLTWPLMVLGTVLCFAALFWRRSVTIRLTRFEVQVDAYRGLLGRPVRRALPLDQLRWEWIPGVAVLKNPTYLLCLESGDEPPLELHGLLCAPGQREILTEALTAARARSVEGGDAAAVPRELNDLRAQAVEPPRQ